MVTNQYEKKNYRIDQHNWKIYLSMSAKKIIAKNNLLIMFFQRVIEYAQQEDDIELYDYHKLICCL